jgi:hypothetical protein
VSALKVTRTSTYQIELDAKLAERITRALSLSLQALGNLPLDQYNVLVNGSHIDMLVALRNALQEEL